MAAMASTQKKEVDLVSSGGHVFDLFGEDMVTIEVGSGGNAKRFMVHKKLLCKKAAYFDKMFNGAFKEGVEQKVTFPEDDIDAWALLIEWIYRDKDFGQTIHCENDR